MSFRPTVDDVAKGLDIVGAAEPVARIGLRELGRDIAPRDAVRRLIGLSPRPHIGASGWVLN